MVGGIVAAGMMGGLALVLANMSKHQQSIQKRTATHFEVESLFNSIEETLYNKDACLKTLNAAGTLITDGKNIDFIKNRENGVIFNKTSKYGNNLVQIKSMKMKNIAIVGTSGTLDFRIEVEKLSNSIKGYRKVIRDLPISIEVAAVTGGIYNLVQCHHSLEGLPEAVTNALDNEVGPHTDSKINAVVQNLCPIFGGVFDPDSKRCSRVAAP